MKLLIASPKKREMAMNHNSSLIAVTTITLLMALGLGACKQQGPLEKAGEEVDETIDTVKHGGKESTATKLDDAADDLRDGAKDAAKDLKAK